MRIDSKDVITFKVYITKGTFVCACYSTVAKKTLLFKISFETNANEEYNNMIDLFRYPNFIFCGYGNNHFDNTVINYLIEKYELLKDSSYDTMIMFIKNINNMIIDDPSAKDWSKWKYAREFPSFDLSHTLYSKKNRIPFEEFCLQHNFSDICLVKPDVCSAELDNIAKTAAQNIGEAVNIYEEDILARKAFGDKFGFYGLSKSGLAIGLNIMKKLYFGKTKDNFEVVRKQKSSVSYIYFSEIIDNTITFKTEQCQKLLDRMKGVVIKYGDDWKDFVTIGKTPISVGLGGIHTRNKFDVFDGKDKHLVQTDARSMFPHVLMHYKVHPKHLKETFVDCYNEILKMRLAASHKESTILKESLNAMLGYFQQEDGWMYSPMEAIKIRINAELLMLQLCEELYLNSAELLSINTDGIIYSYPEKKIASIKDVLDDWCKKYDVPLASKRFCKIYMTDVNNYFGLTFNNIEVRKGIYDTKLKLSTYAPISIDAAIEYLLYEVDVENAVNRCPIISNFEYGIKHTDDLFLIDPSGTKTNCGKLVRFVKSKTGSTLADAKQNVVINNVTVTNVHSGGALVDKQHYITKAKSLISNFENKQLSLFLIQQNNGSSNSK